MKRLTKVNTTPATEEAVVETTEVVETPVAKKVPAKKVPAAKKETVKAEPKAKAVKEKKAPVAKKAPAKKVPTPKKEVKVVVPRQSAELTVEEVLESDAKSITRSDLVNIMWTEQGEEKKLNKREINDFISSLHGVMNSALDSSMNVNIGTRPFTRSLVSARIFPAVKSEVMAGRLGNEDTLSLPHVRMAMSVKSGYETVKGAKNDDGTFTALDGTVYDLEEINEKAKEEYAAKYKS